MRMPRITRGRIGLALDMNGCPNRCRHCWLGSASNRRLSPDDVRWAAGQAQEVEVLEGPLTLRMAAYANEAAREYTIMLTNLATNDLAERAIRQVHPSSEIVLKVTPRFDIHEATCLVGPTCAFEAAEESVTVRISSVRFLEGVVLR